EPLTGQAVGHHQRAVLHVRSGHARPSADPGDDFCSRVPSRCRPRTVCRMIRPAATLMQTSATLKTGKFGKAGKSMTWPRIGLGSRKLRSVRLPRTPASRKPSASAQPVLATRRAKQSVTSAAATAIQDRTIVYDVPRLNAAPLLDVR